METERLYRKCLTYLTTLCNDIGERPTGSGGNRRATQFVGETLSAFGWDVEMPTFDALDWEDGGATLQAGHTIFDAQVSPYSLGCTVQEQLVAASTVEELEACEASSRILLLHGEIAQEQLMPKNFVFYNPENHQRIITLLEAKRPGAIITATGRNGALAGGVYPFPLIEDGDFDIPSVYMTEEEGWKLASHVGETVTIISRSRRLTVQSSNVIARKGGSADERIVVTAHIDTKRGTPGAIDNATGVVVLLLLAEQLKAYDGCRTLEIVAFNGEDHYAVPGQMNYINSNLTRFHEVVLNINIDGVGYKDGPSSFSFFDLSIEFETETIKLLEKFAGITEGGQWYQGDHSMFVQQGRPAIAITSQWLLENLDHQTVTHTVNDTIDKVDCRKLVEVSKALGWLIHQAEGERR